MTYNSVTMGITYYAPFKRFVKKAIKPLKAEIEDSVFLICEDVKMLRLES